jgi:hypothetical protein
VRRVIKGTQPRTLELGTNLHGYRDRYRTAAT